MSRHTRKQLAWGGGVWCLLLGERAVLRPGFTMVGAVLTAEKQLAENVVSNCYDPQPSLGTELQNAAHSPLRLSHFLACPFTASCPPLACVGVT